MIIENKIFKFISVLSKVCIMNVYTVSPLLFPM